MAYRVWEGVWSDTPVICLSDDAASAVARIAPALGGNLFSLVVAGQELLRTPPDADAIRKSPSRWGVPVLMPPNRIAGGRFQFEGREYQLESTMPQGHHNHGFVLRRPWLIKASEVTPGGAVAVLEFDAVRHADVLAQFPHPFRLTLTYTLAEGMLRCEAEIANPGDAAMPFGLGFHPYLAAPVGETDRFYYRLNCPVRQWELVEALPTGRFAEVSSVRRDWVPLYPGRLDDGFAVVGDGRESAFELQDRSTGRVLRLEAGPQFRHWVLFNGAPATFEGFVSPEPYTCMTNAFNLDLPRSVSGMQVVAAGEARPAVTWTLRWTQSSFLP